MIKVRRTIFLLAAITLGVPAGRFALQARQQAALTESEAQQADAEQLVTTAATLGIVESNVSAVGVIEADETARVSFRDPGRITALQVRVGDRVEAGAILAMQDDASQRLALEAADLALAAAELQRAALFDGPTEADLAIADANIEAAQGAVNSILNAVDADLIRAAELQYQAAQQAVADAQAARASSGGSAEAIALLDAQVGEAAFNAEIARLSLENAQRGSSAQVGAALARVDQARAERERLMAGPLDAQVQAADAAIERARIAVERAEQTLAQTLITAPFAGVVAGVSAEVGSIALPNSPVVTIARVEPLRLRVNVDEIDVRQVQAGMDARVRVDAVRGLELAARLDKIALVPTISNGIVTYDVEVVLLETDPRVRLGMTAEAFIVVERRVDVLVVPNEYIRLGRGINGASVDILGQDNVLIETPITLGLQGATTSEVTSGLRPGDVVAIDIGGSNIFGG